LRNQALRIREEVELVGYWYTKDGRYPMKEDVVKIMGWETGNNQKDVRAFLGMCAYYCYWIVVKVALTNPPTRGRSIIRRVQVRLSLELTQASMGIEAT
jgi:hypothetical protein